MSSNSSYYDDFYERGGWERDGQYPFRVFKSLSKVLALPSDTLTTKSALDLGCGLGEFSEALAETGYGDVVGIDLSSKGIELAEKNPFRSKRTHFICTDFFHHDFEDRKFDFILAIGFPTFAVSDLQQADRTLQRLRSLVSPSGSITITVPNSGRSGGKTWYSWSADEIETVRQLANRYFQSVEMHLFTRIARPRWPAFIYSRLKQHILGVLCAVTGRCVMLSIVLRSPKGTNEK